MSDIIYPVGYTVPVEAQIPQQITMRQARLALLGAGLLSQVNAAISAMTGIEGQQAQITWEYSGAVERHEPMVLALGPALGLTDAQMDALFIAGAAL